MTEALQRIRYEKKGDKELISHPITSKKGSTYVVTVDLSTMTYIIRNQLSFRKYEGGKDINSLMVLKRKIKKHLAHLGCVFGKETRNRTFGRCDRGFSQQKHIEQKKANIEQSVEQK